MFEKQQPKKEQSLFMQLYSISSYGEIWQVIVGVILCQLICGFVSVKMEFQNSEFMSFWTGGAIGGFLGFIIGLMWYCKSKPKNIKSTLPFIIFIGFLVTVVAAAAVFFVIPRTQRQNKLIAELRNIDTQNVRNIEIYNKYGRKLLKSITDADQLKNFTKSCDDVEYYFPNHPRYTKSWYVVVHADKKYELDIHLQEGCPSGVRGNFVHREGNYMRNYGAFTGKKLRPWFEKTLK